MTKSFIIEILNDFVALFYPKYCEACEEPLVKGENLLCAKCILDLPRSNYHREQQNPLYKRLQGRINIQYAIAFFKFRKNSKIQRLLHMLKYKDRPDIAYALGVAYGMELRDANYHTTFDLIVPIPLHVSRLNQRGYNQAEEFAKGLSESLSIPFVQEAVKRLVETKSQTKKSKLSRWQNVDNVFEVCNKEVVVGKHILLVDDIVTTGATLEACGQELVKASCRNLSVACIAVAQ